MRVTRCHRQDPWAPVSARAECARRLGLQTGAASALFGRWHTQCSGFLCTRCRRFVRHPRLRHRSNNQWRQQHRRTGSDLDKRPLYIGEAVRSRSHFLLLSRMARSTRSDLGTGRRLFFLTSSEAAGALFTAPPRRPGLRSFMSSQPSQSCFYSTSPFAEQPATHRQITGWCAL